MQPSFPSFWSRSIAAPGHSAVDFEQRVDFRRRHDDRLGVTLFPIEELFIANRD